MRHRERHNNDRIGWLRAAVLGANDGLISTSGLVVGVSAASASSQSVLIAGLAGLVAGALSMAAGEYVSVSSQADTERADREKERLELATQPEAELKELTRIYEGRGLSASLAGEVAQALTSHDALAAHLRDELGIHENRLAKPLQAAMASAGSFCLGALPPLLLAAMWQGAHISMAISVLAIAILAVLGALGAYLGGAPPMRGGLRVMTWGALAMLATHWIGTWFGAAFIS